jgi:serine protease Do
MKKNLVVFLVAVAGGFVSLAAYRLFFDDRQNGQMFTSNLPVYDASYSGLAESGTLDFTSAAERTVNSVVHVKTQSTVNAPYDPWADFFGYRQSPQVQMSSGSGVIISTDGYIITNNHVVEGADKLEVTLNNNKNYEASVIGRDPSTDIAVIKIEEKNLPAVVWGNSEEVRIGQWVIAVGNPFDLTSTVTAGIVSAKARNINLLGSRERGNEEIFPVESFIQTDAAVNPGNSGGALVNTRGELVGVNTAIASQTGAFAGYSFAVPSTIAKKVAQDIIEFGHVQRAFIGVRIQDVSQEQAKAAGLNDVSGVFVESVTDGGAAAQSGMKQGDIIQKVGEYPVNNVPMLQEQVAKYRPGDKVQVTVWRDGKSQSVEVTLRNRSGKAQLDDFSAMSSETKQALGATFTAPTPEDLSHLRITGGAKVADLQQGKFKSIGMQKGFIITKLDGQPVQGPQDLVSALESKTGKYVEIRGYYSNGMEAMYGFRL